MTYPLIFNIHSHLPYYPNKEYPRVGQESLAFIWNFWRVKQALFQGTNPFFSDYIFYPNGVNLAFHDNTMFNTLLAIPFQMASNLTITYNLLFLLSFILTGFGQYLLVFYLTKNRKASIIAGLLLAFFPYHYTNLNLLSLLSMQWIPFFILYFLKTFKERTIKNSIISSIFLTLVAMSHWYYLTFLIIFVILFFIYNLFHRRNYVFNKKLIKCFILMFLLSGIFIFPFALPMLISDEFQSSRPIDTSVAHSADLISFLVPSSLHSVFGEYVKPFYDHVNLYNGKIYGDIGASTVFIGFLTLFFLFYSKIKEYKKIKFWMLFVFTYFILSLGPALHFNGLVLIPVEGLELDKIAQTIQPNINEDALEILKHNVVIPMPFLILNFIPFFNMIRSPSRFVVMLMLFSSIIVGFVCVNIFNKVKRRKFLGRYNLQNILFLIICLIIIFEFLSIPIPMYSPDIPPFYNFISKDTEDYAIIEIPLCHNILTSYNPIIRQFQFYQITHNKRLLCGHIARYSEKARYFDFINNNSFLYSLAHLDTIDIKTISVPKDFLIEYKLKYIIIHKDYVKEKELNDLKNLLEDNLILNYQDKEIIVYRVY